MSARWGLMEIRSTAQHVPVVEVSGNMWAVDDGVLSIWEQNAYGEIFHRKNFPLANIISYEWKAR